MENRPQALNSFIQKYYMITSLSASMQNIDPESETPTVKDNKYALKNELLSNFPLMKIQLENDPYIGQEGFIKICDMVGLNPNGTEKFLPTNIKNLPDFEQ